MSKIISIHSFRGGTGKSNTTANLAALMAAQGQRVCVVDTDIQSPGIHVLFGIHGDAVGFSLNDYLWGRCEIRQAAIDVTTELGAASKGQIFLVPSSIKSGEIARILREGCDARVLTSGLRALIRALDLDVLILDTHPGLNEETLLSIALSHDLVIIMRPDEQDYEGTGVTIEVASALNVPRMLLLVNRVPAAFNLDAVREKVSQAYHREVVAVIPHSDNLMTLASSGLFVERYPDHSVTTALRQVTARLMS
jgi:MinD-like ATPase involved in chromosome partitioning or flagellar assembly